MSRPIPSHDYVAHFDPAVERHRAWLQAALERLVDHEPDALVEGGPLWRLWSTVPAEAASAPMADSPAAVALAGASGRPHPNPLVGVPYFQQRDCAQLSQLDRTCFSSSCAMLLEALKPGTLYQGANGDDQHLAVHRGPVERPTGSGHWLIVVGHSPTHLVVNDPWGEPDLLSGASLNPNGKGLRFSRQNDRCAGLRLRQALDGGADRRQCLPLCPGQGLGGGGGSSGLRTQRAMARFRLAHVADVDGCSRRKPASGWEQNCSIVSACWSNRDAVAALPALPMARQTTLGGNPQATLRSRKSSSLVTSTRTC